MSNETTADVIEDIAQRVDEFDPDYQTDGDVAWIENADLRDLTRAIARMQDEQP